MSTWTKQKLGDIANVQNGYAFKSQDFSDQGIPVIKIKNMASGKIFFDKDANYSNSLEKLYKYLLHKGDILVSMTGSHLSQRNSAVGKITRYNILNTALLNQRVGKISPKVDKCDNNFLYYLTSQANVQEYWAKKASGTANQANISPEIIKSLPIIIPTHLEVQKTIGAMLSFYDDLIENNEKRIKILEEMAELLYQQWFIKFQFPGYEKVKFIDSGSEYGQIPEGWVVDAISSIANVISGFPFKGSTYEDSGKYKIVTIKNVHDGKFVLNFDSFINDLPIKLPKSCILSRGDILISLTGNVGRICVVYGSDHLLNQRVAKLDPININNKEFIYLLFRQRKFQQKLEAMSNGAAQKNLSPIQVKNIKVVVPSLTILQDFSSLTKKHFEMVISLQEENRNLSKIRDLLIPQLITGKREIKN